MTRQYVLMAVGCIVAGIVMTFVMLVVVNRLGISIEENLWILAIPAVLAVLLNIVALEIYHAYRRHRS